MDDLLHTLAFQIKELVEKQDKIKSLNQKVQHGKSLLLREREIILAKQQKAITQAIINIESLISKLKAIESIPHE
jgi:uncharacterized protein (TIGR02449 family)